VGQIRAKSLAPFLAKSFFHPFHPSLGSRSRSLISKVCGNEAMSFLRHKEIYQSDEPKKQRARLCCLARAHRLDEFPVGYSWQVALQQSPLPLRQPPRIVGETANLGKNFFI
jgi:hypothetical protein